MEFTLAGRLGRGAAKAGPLERGPASFRGGAATESRQFFRADQPRLQHQSSVRSQAGTWRRGPGGQRAWKFRALEPDDKQLWPVRRANLLLSAGLRVSTNWPSAAGRGTI